MKSFLPVVSQRKWLISTLLLLATTSWTQLLLAQLPDCASGTSMYIIYNDSLGANKPSEIRPVNYSTGAVGALMGSTGYTFKKTISGISYYGSSSLGVDGITQRFYANTTMSFNGGPKDFITINTLTATATVIGTTPSVSTANVPNPNGLDDYFFVKMAISPTGTGYAIGVSRDTTVTTPATANPVISFTTCGVAPTVGCSTIKLLGYLPVTPITSNWNIYNGDIAFTSTGDLYYMTASYGQVSGNPRYKDIKLFKILATNIPSVAGTGVIPMTFLADYNTLDSTLLNGLAFDPLGGMYITTRKFNGPQNLPLPTTTNELFKSTSLGGTSIIPGFGPKTAGYTAADLASCYFPTSVLAVNEFKFSGRYANAATNLSWTITNNTAADYFEVQQSDDGNNFSSIASVETKNTDQGTQTYTYNDPQTGYGSAKYYRIREVMKGGMRLYTPIVKITFSNRILSVSNAVPNPFTHNLSVTVELKAQSNISVRLIDNGGRIVARKSYAGNTGNNKLTLDNLLSLQPGLYILETVIDEDVFREKIIKQ